MRVKVKLKTLIELAVLLTLTVLIVYFTTWRILGKPLVYGDTPYVTLNSKKVLEEYLLHAWHREAFGNNYPWPQGHLVTLFFLYLSEIIGFEELHILFNNLSFIFIPLAFYMLTRDFIEDSASRIIASLLYFLNPVTITYFVSGGNLWSLALAPLAIKYYLKTLVRSPYKLQINIKYTMIAGILSAFIMMLYPPFIVPFMFMVFVMLTVQCLTHIERNYTCLKEVLRVLIVFTIASLIILSINAPYVTSIYCNLKDPTLTIASSNIIADFAYTYNELSIPLLLRLAGNLGSPQVTLGYNLNTVNNDIGYLIPLLSLIGTYYVLRERKNKLYPFAIGYVAVIFFVLILRAIIFSGFNKVLLYVPLIWTMRNPFKLQQTFTLLTAITFGLGLGKILNTIKRYSSLKFSFMSKNMMKVLIKYVLIFSVLIAILSYNAVAFDGSLGLIKDKRSLENVFVNEKIAALAKILSTEKHYDYRGIIVPFTHYVELYMQFHAPHYYPGRLGLLSDIEILLNDALKYGELEKILGMYSIKNVILYKDLQKLEFPILWSIEPRFLEKMLDKATMIIKYETQSLVNYVNPYALPVVYITSFPIFYSDVSSLIDLVDYEYYRKKPIFIKAEEVCTSMRTVFYNNETYNVLFRVFEITLPSQSNYTLFLSVNVERTIPIFYSIDNEEIRVIKVTPATQVLDIHVGMIGKGRHRIAIGIPVDKKVITWETKVQGKRYRFISEKEFVTSNGFLIYSKRLSDFTLYLRSKLLKHGEKSWNTQSILLCYNKTNGTYFRIVFHKTGLIELAKSINFKYTPSIYVTAARFDLKDLELKIDKVNDTLTIHILGSNETYTFKDKDLARKGYLVFLSDNSNALWSNVTVVNYLVSFKGFILLSEACMKYTVAQYSVLEFSPYKIIVSLSTPLKHGYFYIVFNERFSKYWRIKVLGLANVEDVSVKHLIANKFFNAWIIEYQNAEALRNMRLEIYYDLEKTLVIGEIIAVITLIAITAIVIIYEYFLYYKTSLNSS